MGIYDFGQQNNGFNPQSQAPATSSSPGGFSSFFAPLVNGVKSLFSSSPSAPAATPSTYNSFGTPSTYNFGTTNASTSSPTVTPPVSHFAPSHSVTTKVGSDGSQTTTTTPVTTGAGTYQSAPTQAASTQANTYGAPITDTSGNTGTAQFNPMTGQPLTPPASSTGPVPFGSTPFTTDTSGDNGTYGSDSLTGGTSYSDIMAQRDQMEQNYQQAYNTYLQSQVGYQNLVNSDQANAIQAGYTGDTAAYGQGAAGLATRTNSMKELAASSALNTASIPVQAAQTGLNYANANLQNYYSAAGLQLSQSPQFSGQTVNQSTGDIYGFMRDPVTGAVSTQVLGNVYSGSYGNTGAGGGSTTGGAMNTTGGGQTQISPLIQPYLTQSIGGQAYIDSDRIPANQSDAIKIQAANAGIPVLTTDEVSKVRAIDQTSQNLTNIGNTIQSILKPGILGRGLDAVENPIKDFLQSDTNISSFDSYRTAAINAIQALGGGSGSGFRLTQSEIDTATSNLPTISDNLETAQAKIAKMQTYLSQWTGELFPGQESGATQGSSGDGSGLYNF